MTKNSSLREFAKRERANSWQSINLALPLRCGYATPFSKNGSQYKQTNFAFCFSLSYNDKQKNMLGFNLSYNDKQRNFILCFNLSYN